MDNSKIKEVAKFIANRDSLQEQVLLEFPMKMGSYCHMNQMNLMNTIIGICFINS
jgi:hypothetical protein